MPVEKMIRRRAASKAALVVTCALALAASGGLRLDSAHAQPAAAKASAAAIKTTYVRDAEAVLFEPAAGVRHPVAIAVTHPDGDNFPSPIGPELAKRGYYVLAINGHGAPDPEALALSISQGITDLRALPGVKRVVLLGHSGGGHLIAFYENVAENGVAACQGPEKIVPCRGGSLGNLARPDGIAFVDPTLGAFHQASAVDPAVGEGGQRDKAVDMFDPANGYDPATGAGHYSADFAKRFYAAQAARNAAIVDKALQRLKALKEGRGEFSDDEPLVIRGMGVDVMGARLYQPDVNYAAHTRQPHLLLKSDGTTAQTIIQSVRPPFRAMTPAQLHSLGRMTQNTTVRRFLATSAFRTLPGYAITADDVTGADWHSAMTATPGNAEGITVPALVLTMSCHYLVVPGEIVFDHLRSADKTYASVEGATHIFMPCRSQYGDTAARTFDFIDQWLSAPGRFS